MLDTTDDIFLALTLRMWYYHYIWILFITQVFFIVIIKFKDKMITRKMMKLHMIIIT